MRFNSDVLFSAVSMAVTATSAPIDLTNVALLSIQTLVQNAAAPTGTLAYQFSNDKVNWATDATITAPAVTANGSSIQTIANVGHLWMRAVFTAAAGAGTLTVTAGTKGV